MRTDRPLAVVAALLASTVLAACTHVPYVVSKDDQERFGKNLITVTLPKRADPLILGASDCKLYRAKIEHQDIVGWDVTLAADWAARTPAFLTGCMDESLSWDGKYVRVYFCARTIGAGGGCNNGGYYRSRTGARPWQSLGDRPNDWEPLPEYAS